MYKKCMYVLTTVALTLTAGAGVFAQQVPEGAVLFTPAKAKWAPGRIPGLESAPISGDQFKPGPYVQQVKFPANFKLQPHSHPDVRYYTILSGTWYIGFGEKFDESKLIALPPGSYYTEPANKPHFVLTKEAVVVQIGGSGPTAVKFVDPAHEPKKK